MNEEDHNVEGFVLGPDNIGRVFRAVRRASQKVDIEVATSGAIRISKCKICEVAMLTQPPAMVLTANGPHFFCEEHIPDAPTVEGWEEPGNMVKW